MDDSISRQAAIDALNEIHYMDREDWVMVMDTMDFLPSVEPQRKKGRWVRKDDYYNGIIMRVCKCSACDANAGIGKDGFWYKSNYCPNCGAEMQSTIGQLNDGDQSTKGGED